MTSAQTVNRGRIRLETSPKRVRVQLDGLTVADSSRAVLVWEKPYYPTYYFPIADVRIDLLVPDSGVSHSPSRGDGTLYTVTAGGRTAPGAAVRYAQSPIPELQDLVRFDWDAMDHWFEEDEEVYTHPRDPYTRVDILASSRRVQVEVDGVIVADSTSPRLLFETGLPTRYYFPRPTCEWTCSGTLTVRRTARTKGLRSTGRSRSTAACTTILRGRTRRRSRRVRRSPASSRSTTRSWTSSSTECGRPSADQVQLRAAERSARARGRQRTRR